MAFDEVEFLTALDTYMSANITAAQTHIIESTEPASWYNLHPPFYGIRDGQVENVGYDECHIMATLEIIAVVKVLDEAGGQVTGRTPVATWRGVSYFTQLLQTYLTYDNLITGMSLTNSQLKSVHWTEMSPSESLMFGDTQGNIQAIWQQKTITLEFGLRVL